MTGGLRLPIAWPHDGNVHDKGSGLGLAVQFKSYGANMMPKHAINHGTTDFRVEPGLQEMREMMFTGQTANPAGQQRIAGTVAALSPRREFQHQQGHGPPDRCLALRGDDAEVRQGALGMRRHRLRPAALCRPAARQRSRLRVRHRHAKSPRRRVRPVHRAISALAVATSCCSFKHATRQPV